jgi:hypothetical protein
LIWNVRSGNGDAAATCGWRLIPGANDSDIAVSLQIYDDESDTEFLVRRPLPVVSFAPG